MGPIIMNGSRANILLAAIVLITIISLFLAMAIRPVRTAHQRLLEQELVYRGEHLADGIRRFYLARGRFPFSLEELVEKEPLFVRRIYTDPMTQDGEWILVYLTPADKPGVTGLDALSRVFGERETENNSENEEEKSESLSGGKDSVFGIKTQQITGLRSKSMEEGLMVRDESKIYTDWLFSALPKTELDFNALGSQLMDAQ